VRVKKQINIEIGEQVKIARENLKMTQEQFAERIEVSPQYISDLERGVVGISIPTLKRACTVLGVSSDWILFGIKSQNRSAALDERCRDLSDEQFKILLEIVSKFTEALKTTK
jgi:transcriptional regulator with XRE-family HTH domain